MYIRVLGCGVVLTIAALVGCGSSSGSGGTGGSTGQGGSTGTGTGGSGGAFTTSVSSGTKLTGLTSAQATQLCSDFQNYERSYERSFDATVCRESVAITNLEAAWFYLVENPSATSAQLQAACAQSAADAGACDLTLNSDGGFGSCNVTSAPSTCQATVGDYTKCINDIAAALVAYTSTIPSCSSLTAASVSALFPDGGAFFGVTEPASCSQFDTTCSTTTDANASLSVFGL